MASFLNSFMSSATSLWDTPQLGTLRSNAELFLDYTRVELEKSKLGLNWTLVLIVLLSIVPAIMLRMWVSDRKLPPSPRGFPIIGHLHLLGSHAHESMTQLSQKYGPVMYLKLGSQDSLVISSPEHAKEVIKNHDLTFSERPQLIVLDLLITNKQGISFQSMNPSWRNLRKILNMELLSPKRLNDWQPIREKELNHMLSSIFEQSTRHPNIPLEVKAKLWVLTTNVTSGMILSKRYFSDEGEPDDSEEAKEFKYVMEEMMHLVGSIFPADCFPFLKWFDLGGFEKRTKLLYPRFQNLLTRILSERRSQRQQVGESYVDVDLVDVLLTQQARGGDVPVTEGNIRGVVWDIFAGGTETQVAIVEWVMAHLLKYPEMMEMVKAELDMVVGLERKVEENDIARLKYLEAVVKETFRLHPPAPLLVPRESAQACIVAGYVVPAGTRLFINVYAIGRDARVWKDPLRFQPQRFLQGLHQHVDLYGQYPELMPFGTGRRICPAANMGLLQVSLFLANLIHAFDWSLPKDVQPDDLDMSEAAGLTTPMATPLRAIPTPRLPHHLYHSFNT